MAENVAGGKTNLNVTRTGTALASGVLVDYTATGDTTAITLPSGSTSGTLTFGAGQTSVPLVVTIMTNPTAEPDRNMTFTLSNARSIGPAAGANAPTISLTGGITTLKIVDDEPRVQFSAAASTVTEGGMATITVTRSGSPSGQVTVDYATGGGTAVPTDALHARQRDPHLPHRRAEPHVHGDHVRRRRGGGQPHGGAHAERSRRTRRSAPRTRPR